MCKEPLVVQAGLVVQLLGIEQEVCRELGITLLHEDFTVRDVFDVLGDVAVCVSDDTIMILPQ